MLARREDIDLARELHKVYKMLCVNQAKLIAMKGRNDCIIKKCINLSFDCRSSHNGSS